MFVLQTVACLLTSEPQKSFFFPTPPLPVLSVKEPVLSKSYVPLMKTQFMALNQVTFSCPMCLSAADLKTAAFSIFLDQIPFGPHCDLISSPML